MRKAEDAKKEESEIKKEMTRIRKEMEEDRKLHEEQKLRYMWLLHHVEEIRKPRFYSCIVRRTD